MMPSNYWSENTIDCNGQLLRDIEEISKALYLHKYPTNSLKPSAHVRSQSIDKTHVRDSKSKSRPSSNDDECSQKGKRLSLWQWKPPTLKSLSHMWHRKYSCCFFCQIHSIEDLPIDFNDLSLSVHWKKKEGHVMKTLPSNVSNGMVEFDETLMDRCSIYGTKSGSENLIKYEPKHCLLYASIVGASGVDLGRHWVDLTRLLPLTFEELEENRSPGKWTTSFNLAGKAKGATLQVSFGYMVVKDDLDELGGGMNFSQSTNLKQNRSRKSEDVAGLGSRMSNAMLRRAGSVHSGATHDSTNSSLSSDSNSLHEVCSNHGSEFSSSINLLHQKLDEGRNMSGLGDFNFVFQHLESLMSMPNSLLDSGNDSHRTEHDTAEFTIIDKGIEFEYSSKELWESSESTSKELDISAEEVINVAEIFEDEGLTSDQETKLDDIAEIAGSRPSVFVEKKEYSCSCTIDSNVVEVDFMDKVNSVAELFKDEGMNSDQETKLDKKVDISGGTLSVFVEEEHNWSCITESNVAELDFKFHDMCIPEPAGPDIMVVRNKLLEDNIREEVNLNDKRSRTSRSPSLDDVTKAVADDFCNLLQDNRTDSEDESPKERLWRQFEDEMLASGGLLFGSGQIMEEETELTRAAPTYNSLESIIEDLNLHTGTSPVPSSRSNAKGTMLERLETQSLMQEWGLNDDAFVSSPSNGMGGFGSPISVAPEEEPVGLPPIGEDLGSFLQIKGGGFLRSMSTSLFRNATNDIALIMQASQPVVLPLEMGSSIMEILQCMASVGPETLSEKVHTLMVLTDVSGKLIQQLAWDPSPKTDVSNRKDFWQYRSDFSLNLNRGSRPYFSRFLCSAAGGSESRYASIEDVVAVAMDKIEVLSIEGLRIQSGMPGIVAPSSISLESVGEAYPELDNRAMGFQVPGIMVNDCPNVETLLDHSVPLDEWVRMDAEILGDEDQVSEHISKTAFHLTDLERYRQQRNDASPSNQGFLGNNLTVAFTVQLRDPMRNYEPVGGPMLALVQVERFFESSTPNSATNCSIRSAEVSCKMEDTAQPEEAIDCVKEDGFCGGEGISRFRMKGVHVAGLITEPEEIWATRRQQQSGSRWLLASNMMNKSSKSTQLSRSTAIILHPLVTRKKQPQSYLWSISCDAEEVGIVEAGELIITRDPYMRNPDIIFPTR